MPRTTRKKIKQIKQIKSPVYNITPSSLTRKQKQNIAKDLTRRHDDDSADDFLPSETLAEKIVDYSQQHNREPPPRTLNRMKKDSHYEDNKFMMEGDYDEIGDSDSDLDNYPSRFNNYKPSRPLYSRPLYHSIKKRDENMNKRKERLIRDATARTSLYTAKTATGQRLPHDVIREIMSYDEIKPPSEIGKERKKVTNYFLQKLYPLSGYLQKPKKQNGGLYSKKKK